MSWCFNRSPRRLAATEYRQQYKAFICGERKKPARPLELGTEEINRIEKRVERLYGKRDRR